MAKGDIRKFLAVVAVVGLVVAGCSESESDKQKKAQAAEKAVAAEKARLDAMTPAEKEAELKQKAFVAMRTLYGNMLTNQIKASAFDPDALKIKSPEYYKNGVCVQANGKNRFGAYVGFQEYCYLYENDKWTYSGPN